MTSHYVLVTSYNVEKETFVYPVRDFGALRKISLTVLHNRSISYKNSMIRISNGVNEAFLDTAELPQQTSRILICLPAQAPKNV